MLSKRWVLLILAVCILSATASATSVFSVQLETEKEWVVANNSDSSVVSAYVVNKSLSTGELVPLSGITVVFDVLDKSYGTLSKYEGTTDSSGYAKTIFKAEKKKGNVTITATAEGISTSMIQYIDHDSPYYVTFDYEGEVIVNETTTVTATYSDLWGNLIDELNAAEIHSVNFQISSPKENAGFLSSGSYLSNVTRTIDNNGIITLECKVDSTPGDNIVYMAPVSKIGARYFTISGVSRGIPFSMILKVYPVGDGGTDPTYFVKTDGESYFVLNYILYDAFGNPTMGRNLSITTDAGESYIYPSNAVGTVNLTYGPRDTIGTITITAVALDNSSVTNQTTVSFFSSQGVDIILTANPETMPSYDVDTSFTADISAKVIDIVGNPVPDEEVSFTMGTVSYDETYNATYRMDHPPALLGSSAISDSDGYATVQFRPGGFTTTKKDLNYDATATGHAVITATWRGNSKSMAVTWKNYPYLSVETGVSPSTVAVNGTVDVTIRLKGDGWALQPDPIDVVLVMDRSGSMSDYLSGTTTRRLAAAKTAAKTFVNQMNATRDRVALVSYGGYTEGTETRTDRGLTNSFALVRSSIDSLNALGATETRAALKQGIEHLTTNPNPDPGAVQAVILLTDGNYNWMGNPLGRGTGWPADNPDASYSTSSLEPYDYRYYTGLGGTLIPYGTTTTCSVYSTTVCDNYANRCDTCAVGYTAGSGGTCCKSGRCYTPSQRPSSCSVRQCSVWHCDSYLMKYKCTDGEFTSQNMSRYALDNYIKIYAISFAGSFDSQAVSDMQVMANATGGFYEHAPNEDKLNEIYNKIAGELMNTAGVNTTMDIKFENVMVTTQNVTNTLPGDEVFDYVYNVTDSTRIVWQNGTVMGANPPPALDQMDDWEDDNNLKFYIGEIKLGESWEATFRLKVLKAGNIDIFGNESSIGFEGGAGMANLSLPHTWITAVENINTTGMEATALDVDHLQSSMENKNVTDYIPVTWTLDYSGTDTELTERIYYTNQPVAKNQWILFETRSVPATTSDDSANLDVRTLPYGDYYIRVYAKDSFGYWDEDVTDSAVTVGSEGTAYIKLE